VGEGEYTAIVGGNGSGKTTLAKHMNGLLRPSSGQILVAGTSAAQKSVSELSRTIGYAFQNPDHQLFSSTVQDEVEFGPTNINLDKVEVKRRADAAIEMMDLEQVRDKPPLSLPLGLRRKVSIASVIAMDPRMLILDEPTTGLDADEAEALMDCVRRMNSEGKTVVLITHEMKLVAEHANRVIVMAEGRIVLDSDPRGTFSDLALLKQSKLLPPPVTLLAHHLAIEDMSRGVFTPEELAFELLRGGVK
jgi:energy-coupling factor transport system ATP-binding protein